jgi:hypothetical protein
MRVKAATMAILVLLVAGCASSDNQSTTAGKPAPLSVEAQNLATIYASAFKVADAVKLRGFLDNSTDARSNLADAIIENAEASLRFRKLFEQEMSSAKGQMTSSCSMDQQMNIVLTGGFAFADSPQVLVLTAEGWRVRFMKDATEQSVLEMVSIQKRRTTAINRFLDASDKNGAMGTLVGQLMASLTEELNVFLQMRGGTDEFMRTIVQVRMN